MADHVAVDTEGVRSPTARLQELAERISSVAHHLEVRLESFDTAFGDDKAGQKYRANYVEPRNQLLIGIPALSAVIEKVATNLEIMSRDYEQTEDEAITSARRMGSLRPVSPGRAPLEGGEGGAVPLAPGVGAGLRPVSPGRAPLERAEDGAVAGDRRTGEDSLSGMTVEAPTQGSPRR